MLITLAAIWVVSFVFVCVYARHELKGTATPVAKNEDGGP
jgi:hypothetical protein